ncbi:MAG: adenylyl-sulfate reductase [Alphaproteobacteria bacterium]|nr:adenylyl-sulfate reductase [Alphaproteobacteria bacterium]
MDFNPFAALGAFVAPRIMQGFVIAMTILVLTGTLFDILHKGNGAYFFANRRKARGLARRELSGGEKLVLAVETAAEALISGEFCSTRRRIAHLLAMYGFIAYVLSTVLLVFWYAEPNSSAPPILPLLWHIGAALILVGGCWFWFFIRVDAAAEGHSPLRFVRADLFIVALLKNAALALIWSWLLSMHSAFALLALLLYLISALILFGSAAWSKLPHMFYKPAAAFQRRIEEARGSRMNLPAPADLPKRFGNARELPRHY